MFERFTKAGIAIAGIDVGESYGSPDGRKLFSAFYRELTEKRGFAPKPVLLGRSRGGLMTLGWAVENADKVGGFAGIYPVCNIASYPGVPQASGAYRLKPDELAAQARRSQSDRPTRRAGQGESAAVRDPRRRRQGRPARSQFGRSAEAVPSSRWRDAAHRPCRTRPQHVARILPVPGVGRLRDRECQVVIATHVRHEALSEPRQQVFARHISDLRDRPRFCKLQFAGEMNQQEPTRMQADQDLLNRKTSFL